MLGLPVRGLFGLVLQEMAPPQRATNGAGIRQLIPPEQVLLFPSDYMSSMVMKRFADERSQRVGGLGQVQCGERIYLPSTRRNEHFAVLSPQYRYDS